MIRNGRTRLIVCIFGAAVPFPFYRAENRGIRAVRIAVRRVIKNRGRVIRTMPGEDISARGNVNAEIQFLGIPVAEGCRWRQRPKSKRQYKDP